MNIEKLDFILEMRSIRRFTDQKVDSEKIKPILTAAMYAPSAVHRQPWHFMVIDESSMMDKIMEIHPHARMLQSAFSRLLKLPSHVLPFALVALGYPEEHKPRPERFYGEKVRYNVWNKAYFQE